jgi:DNA-binding NarL/FixJ family response regulator
MERIRTLYDACMNQVTLVIADNSPLYLQALHERLDLELGLNVLAAVSSGRAALQAARDLRPDVVAFGAQMGDLACVEMLDLFHGKEFGELRLAVVSADPTPYNHLSPAKYTRLLGIFDKSADIRTLITAVLDSRNGENAPPASEEVLFGRRILESVQCDASLEDDRELIKSFKTLLTRREVLIACLVGAGRSNAQIARLLSITDATAKNHVYNTSGKMTMEDRNKLGSFVWRLTHNLPYREN